MRIIAISVFILLSLNKALAQAFIRSQLSTSLTTPWEIIYGPDNFLWITEAEGKISRVDPVSGNKTLVYTAPDYFGGAPSEQLMACFQPNIGAGTLGMALHPDFTNSATSYIYFVYSYNSGTSAAPSTKFKIERLTWDAAATAVVASTTIVQSMPSGYDHLGGRLMIITQNDVPYLFLSVGDHGISEMNSPACYTSQANNPNVHAQDPDFKNGKIHRFNLDGSIPATNPIPGNSVYSRGHRNPQGLMYNPVQQIIYNTEHGDRTDDEINIIEAGKNYGWKYVRGFHSDNNYPGESAFVGTYVPDPSIVNDGLKEPMFTWCSTSQPTTAAFLDWCTVAPSDGLYYGSTGIPDWTNSLLIVTLKNGPGTDQELYQLKLDATGTMPVSSTLSNPNPKRFFGEDQAQNGRLRDIAVSPDGKKLFLINNGGNTPDKITVYTYNGSSGLNPVPSSQTSLEIYPNPSSSAVNIQCSESIYEVKIYDLSGRELKPVFLKPDVISITELQRGTYFLSVKTVSGKKMVRKIVRRE